MVVRHATWIGCALLAMNAGCTVVQSLVASSADNLGCAGKTCDPDQWLVVRVIGGTVRPQFAGVGLPAYELDFADSENVVSSASMNPKNLVLALVTRDGVLHLAEYGAAAAFAGQALDARAVAWSNGGDRLAVLVGAAGEAAPQLLILDADLNRQNSAVIPQKPLRDVNLSWNADDSLVAVGTGGAGLAAACFLYDPAANAVDTYDGANCIFVGQDELVGQTEAFEWQRLTLGSAGIASSVLAGPQPIAVLASYPPEGVFATIEEGIVPMPLGVWRTGLRTLDAGPATFTGNSFAHFLMVPLGQAQAVL